MTNNDKLILYVWHNFISHLLSVICFLIDSSKIAELTQQITRKVILLLQHIDKNVMSWNLTTRSSAVTGGDVVGECGRLSQLSFWAHYNIAYLLTHLPTCCAAKYCHLLWYLLLLFARLCRCRKFLVAQRSKRGNLLCYGRVCLYVRLSVRHTRESRLNGSRYRNTLCTTE